VVIKEREELTFLQPIAQLLHASLVPPRRRLPLVHDPSSQEESQSVCLTNSFWPTGGCFRRVDEFEEEGSHRTKPARA
jgi:hypothetical protein